MIGPALTDRFQEEAEGVLKAAHLKRREGNEAGLYLRGAVSDDLVVVSSLQFGDD